MRGSDSLITISHLAKETAVIPLLFCQYDKNGIYLVT